MHEDEDPVGPRAVAPLSIEQLEAGLRVMSEGSTDLHHFWDDNVEAFRKTVLFAIRETSDALLSPRIPAHWRIELEAQLEDLVRYMEVADRYILARFSCAQPEPELRESRIRFH